MKMYDCEKVTEIDKEGIKYQRTSTLGKCCSRCKDNKICDGLETYETMAGALRSINKMFG